MVRLGQIISRIYEPGLHLKLPFVDVAKFTNVQTQKIEKVTESASRDLQIVHSTIALNYRLDATKVIELYQ